MYETYEPFFLVQMDHSNDRLGASPSFRLIILCSITSAFLEVGNPSPDSTNQQNTYKYDTAKGAYYLQECLQNPQKGQNYSSIDRKSDQFGGDGNRKNRFNCLACFPRYLFEHILHKPDQEIQAPVFLFIFFIILVIFIKITSIVTHHHTISRAHSPKAIIVNWISTFLEEEKKISGGAALQLQEGADWKMRVGGGIERRCLKVSGARPQIYTFRHELGRTITYFHNWTFID